MILYHDSVSSTILTVVFFSNTPKIVDDVLGCCLTLRRSAVTVPVFLIVTCVLLFSVLPFDELFPLLELLLPVFPWFSLGEFDR